MLYLDGVYAEDNYGKTRFHPTKCELNSSIHRISLRQVRYQLKTPYRDGTTRDKRGHVIFELLDIIARLAAVVLKPSVDLTHLDEKHPYFSPFGQPMVVQIHSR
ncbi:transposase [Paraglaciecola sp. 20A4]|uniref:transposase n=1 Tax=Paraglaciecola sp. 20A4 TaxID=2687288 RepID=UPI00140CCCD3|nr:transposase [Paraglaciecola sp. 20A4]